MVFALYIYIHIYSTYISLSYVFQFKFLVYFNILCLLKARNVKPAETAIAGEWLYKHALF
jgi:hypothetical protein